MAFNDGAGFKTEPQYSVQKILCEHGSSENFALTPLSRDERQLSSTKVYSLPGAKTKWGQGGLYVARTIYSFSSSDTMIPPMKGRASNPQLSKLTYSHQS